MDKNDIFKKKTIVKTKSGIKGIVEATPTLNSNLYKIILENGKIGYFKKNELKKV